MLIWPLHESNLMLFKSILVVSGVLFGIILIIIYFTKIKQYYLKEGIILGITWFLINILLDIIFLVIIFKEPLIQYIIEVGIRYFNIIIMCAGAGILLKINNKEKSKIN